MNRRSAVIALGAMAALLAACTAAPGAPGPTPTQKAGGGGQIANPAASYCVEKGYQSQIRTGTDGAQYGVCLFPDGTECDEWAFFRGECQPGAPRSPTQPAQQRISVPDVGIEFDVPAAWQRLGQDWVWARSDGGEGRLAVLWQVALPGRELESMLPQNSVVLGRTEGPTLSWGTAATYRLQVLAEGGQGQVKALEAHILVRLKDHLCDFGASGATESELAVAEAALHSLLESVSLTQ